MVFIKDLKESEQIQNIYYIKNKTIGTTKNGNEYFNVSLQDKTGSIEGKIWDTMSPSIDDFCAGNFVKISGLVQSYNNSLQVRIDRLQITEPKEYNKIDYFPTSKYNSNEMYNELLSIIDTVKKKDYKKILTSLFIENEEFKIKFINHQGGKAIHHSFINGLLEHTLYVTKIARGIASNYLDISMDLVVTAAICHDIGKVYEIIDFPINEYIDEGNLIGHVVLSYEIVQNEYLKMDNYNVKNKNELLHCILSHHSMLEYGSPKLPSLMEAYIVSSADNIDSKIEILREGIRNAKVNNKIDSAGFVGYNKFLNKTYRETSRS